MASVITDAGPESGDAEIGDEGIAEESPQLAQDGLDGSAVDIGDDDGATVDTDADGIEAAWKRTAEQAGVEPRAEGPESGPPAGGMVGRGLEGLMHDDLLFVGRMREDVGNDPAELVGLIVGERGMLGPVTPDGGIHVLDREDERHGRLVAGGEPKGAEVGAAISIAGRELLDDLLGGNLAAFHLEQVRLADPCADRDLTERVCADDVRDQAAELRADSRFYRHCSLPC